MKTLAYFNCGHAAFENEKAVILYQLPSHLSGKQLIDYLPKEAKGAKIFAHAATFCGICNKGASKTQHLLDTLWLALDEEAITMTPAELVSEARKQLALQGVKPQQLNELVPPNFVYVPTQTNSSS